MLELDGQVMAHINITATKPFISSIVTRRQLLYNEPRFIYKQEVCKSNLLFITTYLHTTNLLSSILIGIIHKKLPQSNKKNREKQSSGD